MIVDGPNHLGSELSLLARRADAGKNVAQLRHIGASQVTTLDRAIDHLSGLSQELLLLAGTRRRFRTIRLRFVPASRLRGRGNCPTHTRKRALGYFLCEGILCNRRPHVQVDGTARPRFNKQPQLFDSLGELVESPIFSVLMPAERGGEHRGTRDSQ